MEWKRNVLVVANRTIGSTELRDELRVRCQQRPTTITLLLPDRHTAEAEERLQRALAELREDGVEVEGRLANPDPFLAVHEAWDPAVYDEILISTLPTARSRWLEAGLPRRIERHTGALVSVVSGRQRTAAGNASVSGPERATARH
jgi:hypothetical protein